MGKIDPNTIALIVLAILHGINTILTILARRDIRKIEVATNSMKDRLVASTAKASKAEGREEMRQEQKN